VRIAVAGAGIAGLTAAIALARRGFSVDLFERALDLQEVGAGIQLSPNAALVLEKLGVADDLAGTLTEPEAVEIRTASSGALLARIPLGASARRRWSAGYSVVHRADLHKGLLAAARRDPRITLALRADVHDVRATDSGVVFSAGGRRHLADLLVAADGVHSRIRTTWFGHSGARPLGRMAWRATLPMAEVPDAAARDVTGLWLAPGAHLVHYPVHGGASLNVVAIAAAEAASRPPEKRFGAKLRPLLAAVPEWIPWPLVTVDERLRWAQGRVVLIGDAAHAMAPSAAQGGAQAIEDGWALAASVANTPSDPAEALVTYEGVRRRRIERIARAAKRNLTLYELSGFPALFRDLALRLSPAAFLLRRLDWIYGHRPD
jgi:salicylate hydroxylase